jgi:hypothetical protein
VETGLGIVPVIIISITFSALSWAWAFGHNYILFVKLIQSSSCVTKQIPLRAGNVYDSFKASPNAMAVICLHLFIVMQLN